ncbi:MAG: EamA family transporter [Burkholderiales bacterium]|jgi:drug/metabolite transporter (DMT)-like permease
MSRTIETRRAWIVMLLLVLIWGYAWIASKIALRYASALDFSVIRVVFGSVFLFAFLLWSKASLRPTHWKWLIVIGLLQTATFTITNSLALYLGEPGETSILVFIMPFWVIALAWPVLGERILGWQWLALGMAMAGLALILQPWDLHASLVGKALGVLCGIAWAVSVVCAKYLHSREKVDVIGFTFWQMAIGTIPVIAAERMLDTTAIQWNPTFVVCALFVGIGASGLGWAMWLYVLQRLPAGTTSLSSLGVPVVAGFSSWLQLGERPGPLELAGMVLIGIALALVSWLNIRQHEPTEPMMAQE